MEPPKNPGMVYGQRAARSSATALHELVAQQRLKSAFVFLVGSQATPATHKSTLRDRSGLDVLVVSYTYRH